jgi:hypothetical protein
MAANAMTLFCPPLTHKPTKKLLDPTAADFRFAGEQDSFARRTEALAAGIRQRESRALGRLMPDSPECSYSEHMTSMRINLREQ